MRSCRVGRSRAPRFQTPALSSPVDGQGSAHPPSSSVPLLSLLGGSGLPIYRESLLLASCSWTPLGTGTRRSRDHTFLLPWALPTLQGTCWALSPREPETTVSPAPPEALVLPALGHTAVTERGRKSQRPELEAF